MALLKSIATVGVWTMGSRILGFVRDLMIATVLGAGPVTDAFFMAFKFPNLFRRLFGEGAMNAAFVPLYARRLAEEGPEAARKFAGEVASILLGFMLIFSVICMFFMSDIMAVVARGFLSNPEKFSLTVALARITFPYLLFMVIAALLSGMLNSSGRFWAAAAAPILLNLVLITVLFLAFFEKIPAPEYGLAYGVTLAGVFQFLFLLRACHDADIAVHLWYPRLTPPVRRFLYLMAPGVLGAGVVQINILVGDFLASYLADGSVSFLYYADRINQLPLGVIGVAIGVALLPILTRQLRAGEDEAALHSCNRALEIALFLTLPAAVALVAMPWPVVTVLFERGSFDADDARHTAAALQAYALGLPAYVLIKTFSPGFFAREDTFTPVKIAAFVVIFNIILAAALMQIWAHVGIALATALTSWINVIMLAVILAMRGHYRPDRRLLRVLAGLLLAAGLMGAGLYFAAGHLAAYFRAGDFLPLLLLAAMVAGGALVYFICCHLTGAMDFREVKKRIFR